MLCLVEGRPLHTTFLGELFSASLHKIAQRGPGHYLDSLSANILSSHLGDGCSACSKHIWQVFKKDTCHIVASVHAPNSSFRMNLE